MRVCGCVGMHMSERCVHGDASEGMWVCGDARE